MIRDMWSDGLFGKFMTILLLLLICFIVTLPFIIYYDNLEMKAHQCKRNGETRDSFYIQNIYGANGALISSYPVYYTEYKYLCDDGYRWR